MSRFHEIIKESQALANELRQIQGVARDVYGEPHALRWSKWTKDKHGFPIVPDIWWDGEVHTKYGPVTRRTIIELLSERANCAMDTYVYEIDLELKVRYECSLGAFEDYTPSTGGTGE